MRFNLIVAFLLASSTCLYAQTDNEVVNQFIERYIENTSDEVDIQQFASDLLGYFNNPLDINKVDASELFAVPFLTGFQSLEIIEHRKNFGNFISIYELQVLPSFDLEDIRNILPFVQIKSNPLALTSVSKIWKEGTHQFLTLAEITTPKNRGTKIADTLTDQTQSHYIGSPVYNNLRYRFDYKRYISFGVNMEKDANEPFLNSYNPNGYDYYSFYFSARDIGRLKAFHLGDFQANFGQGLTMSTGLAFGKSSIITNAKRNFNGFGAYRSLRENAYLRGTAVAFELNKFTVGVFASYKNVDGNAVTENDSLDSDAPLVTSNIQEDGGYHRTTSELEDKDVFSDFQTGLYAEYKLPFGRIGTANYARKLGAVLEPKVLPYNKFSFTGDSYFKNGLYYDIVVRNINFFGEISHSSFKNSFAQVHGALLSLNRKLDLSFVYRNFDKSFISLQSSGFGENSNVANEEGFYSGFTAKLNRSVSLLGYYDLFTFPWLRFQTNAPSSGNDFWAEIQYKPNKQFRAYYRYRTETKQTNIPGFGIKQLTNSTIQRHRIHLNYAIRKGIELRNRVEWSIYEELGEKSFGSLIYQDIIYKPFGSNLQLSSRIAYSVVEQFENRMYSFEQVPLYDYPLFTHGYSGLRFYVLARYKIKRGFDLWFRYGHTQHEVPLDKNRENYTISSGLQEIEGNKKRTFTLQLRYLIK